MFWHIVLTNNSTTLTDHILIRFEGVGHDSSSGGCDIQYLNNIYKRQVFKPFFLRKNYEAISIIN
jgi:hypothetical protein